VYEECWPHPPGFMIEVVHWVILGEFFHSEDAYKNLTTAAGESKMVQDLHAMT
jgi:hypothetical protein